MHKIAIDQNRKEFQTPEALEKYIKAKCNEHKRDKRALAFAFIVWDFKNASVNRILKQEETWSALNTISGEYLTIFYVDTQDEHWNRMRFLDSMNNISTKGTHFSYFVPISTKSTPLEKTVTYLKETFEIHEDITTPFVVFFQTKSENLTDFFLVKLENEKFDDAFSELTKLITYAVAPLKSAHKKNVELDEMEIFDKLRTGVSNGQFMNAEIGRAHV